MKQLWNRLSGKVDELTLRERAMMFVAAGFVLIAALNVSLLEPLLGKQKMLSGQMQQQEEKSKELQAEMQALLQSKKDDEHSPLRQRIAELKQHLDEQDSYLQTRRDRLVEPDKMGQLLEQVLGQNTRLQLVELKTLPVSLLIEKKPSPDEASQADSTKPNTQKQIYKHGVKISIRGSYLELLQYMRALEKLPTQMFWAEAELTVEKHPEAVLTLVLYTLSLDKTWLTV